MSGLPTSGDTQRRVAGGEFRSRRRAVGLVLQAMLRASLAICERAATSIAPSADGVGVAFGVTWGEQTGDAVGEATAVLPSNDDIMIRKPGEIARSYATTWLVPDLVAALPYYYLFCGAASALITLLHRLRRHHHAASAQRLPCCAAAHCRAGPLATAAA